ncbi:MAG: choice-of-anchor D domain-containing protein [Candidatus Sulfotelmatobacter sp.]
MLALLLGALILTAMAFQCGGPPPPPPVGFQIHTMDEQDLFGTLEDSPGINVVMTFQEDINNNPMGFTDYFNLTTDSNGYATAVNAVVPANWLFQENNGPCSGDRAVATVGNAQTQDLDCISVYLAFNVTPTSLYTNQLPAQLQVAGSGMTTTYGMPHVQIFDQAGNKVADVTAKSVTNGGTILTSPTPNLAGTPTATYGLEVLNVQSNGSLTPVGAAPVPIIASGTATLSPSSLNFGDVSTNGPPRVESVTLTNNNNAVMTISQMTFVGDNGFSVSHDYCGATLAALSACTINLQLDASGGCGKYTGTFYVYDSATNSAQSVALQGVGVNHTAGGC